MPRSRPGVGGSRGNRTHNLGQQFRFFRDEVIAAMRPVVDTDPEDEDVTDVTERDTP